MSDQKTEATTSTSSDQIIQSEVQHIVVRLMDRLHANEIFDTPENRKNFMNGLDYDDFEAWLTRINGMSREIPTTERSVDGTGIVAESGMGVSLLKYIPPEASDRRGLMQECFEQAKKMPDLERAATLLGIGINAIHPFQDGNGRTSRFVYSLLAHGYNGSPADQVYYNEILRENKGRKLVDLDPSDPGLSIAYSFFVAEMNGLAEEYSYGADDKTPHIYGGYKDPMMALADRKPEDLLVNEGVSSGARAKLYALTLEEYFGDAVFFKFLLERGDVKNYITQRQHGDTIDLDALVPVLSTADIDKMMHMQNELKIDYVHSIIEAFADQDSSVADSLVAHHRPKIIEHNT